MHERESHPREAARPRFSHESFSRDWFSPQPSRRGIVSLLMRKRARRIVLSGESNVGSLGNDT